MLYNGPEPHRQSPGHKCQRQGAASYKFHATPGCAEEINEFGEHLVTEHHAIQMQFHAADVPSMSGVYPRTKTITVLNPPLRCKHAL